MKWKKRLTNYNFWLSMLSAVLLVLQGLDIKFDIAYINEIFTAILGLFVVIGIVIDPTKSSTTTTENAEEVITPTVTGEELNNLIQENTDQKDGIDNDAVPNDQQDENSFDLNQADLQTIIAVLKEELVSKQENLKVNENVQQKQITQDTDLRSEKMEEINSSIEESNNSIEEIFIDIVSESEKSEEIKIIDLEINNIEADIEINTNTNIIKSIEEPSIENNDNSLEEISFEVNNQLKEETIIQTEDSNAKDKETNSESSNTHNSVCYNIVN